MPISTKKLLIVTVVGLSLAMAALVAVALTQGNGHRVTNGPAEADNVSAGFVQTAATSDDLYVSAVAPPRYQAENGRPGELRICPASWGSWWHCLYCLAIGYLKPNVGCPSLFNGGR